MNNKIVLSVKNLNKTYNKKIHALRNLNLEVKEGEIFGLLGPNGAGKSTFINILAGLTTKTSGDVDVWGFNMDKNPRQVRASLGIVPQEINVDPFFTPKKLLELQAGLYGVKKKDRITDTILDLVSLNEKANSYTRNLSGGMQRRLLIAKALVHKPPIVILDEPTAGVDVELRKKLLDNVKSLRDIGVTIILTTQYLEEADELANRISIINKGLVVAEGTPDELKSSIGGDVITLTFRTDDDAIKAQTIIENSDIEDNQIRVTVENGAEKIPNLLNQLVSKDINVQSVSANKPSLDDVFLKVTGYRLEGKKTLIEESK